MNGAERLPLDIESLKILGFMSMPRLVLLTTEIRKPWKDDQLEGLLIEQRMLFMT